MTNIEAIILGVVEGLTEFLPVSSTGHLILTGQLLGLPSTDFLKTFEIAIQLGAMAAVLVVYWRRFLLDRATLLKVMAAFVPTAILGFIAYKGVKALLGDGDVVAWSLLIGGVVILLFENLYRAQNGGSGVFCRLAKWIKCRTGWGLSGTGVGIEGMSYRQAVGVGACQALAMVPGVSRSGATVIGGLALGLSRVAIVEFSFLLAVPTILAATGYDFLKSPVNFSVSDIWALAIGLAVSFVVALAVIRWFIAFIQCRDFKVFGYYRIAAAFLYWLIIT